MKQLSEAEKYFKIFFDNAADGMLLADLKTKKIIAGNKFFCQLLGCTPVSLLKKSVSSIHPKENLPIILKKFAALERKKIILAENIPIKKKNGDVFYTDVNASVLTMPDGKKYSLSIIHDTTNSCKVVFDSEKAMRETVAKDEALLASIADGVIAVDSDGKIILFNRAAGVMTGWKKSEVIGRKWYEILRKTDEKDNYIPPEKSAIYLALHSGKISTSASSYYYLRKDGTKFPVSRAVSPVIIGGKTVGAIDVFYDITYERELAQAKNDFLSLASHQLRTPLSAMKWTLEMMMGDADLKEKQKQSLQDIYNSNERLIALVNSLLDAMRIEAGKLTVNKKSSNLVELIDSAYKRCKPLADKRGQKIKLFIDAAADNIEIDPVLFGEVLSNLLSNAIGFGAENSKITIKLSADKNGYIISVHDLGSFILKADYDKIFTKFFRGQNSINSEHVGSGLGLFLVKAAVEGNGGKIWFTSDAKKGTTFYFTIPFPENL
jgi:PAS domain S-box-containing protein